MSSQNQKAKATEIVDTNVNPEEGDSAVASSDNVNAENVREALEQLKIMEVAKGKVGLGGVNKKDVGEHKVR